MITKKEAVDDFLSLREMVKKKDFNSKSVLGNRAVDYGTEKMRKKTKYRNKSHYERWQDKVARDKVIKFAKRLYNQKYKVLLIVVFVVLLNYSGVLLIL